MNLIIQIKGIKKTLATQFRTCITAPKTIVHPMIPIKIPIR
jgi:hypothetical protein